MPTLTKPKFALPELKMPELKMPEFKMPEFKIPQFDAAELFDRADALQTKTLDAAERFTADAVKRVAQLPQPLADRAQALETFQTEFFNRATKIQSANRVFVKRALLGEVAKPVVKTAAASAAPVTKVSKPVAKPAAKKAAKPAVKAAAKRA